MVSKTTKRKEPYTDDYVAIIVSLILIGIAVVIIVYVIKSRSFANPPQVGS